MEKPVDAILYADSLSVIIEGLKSLMSDGAPDVELARSIHAAAYLLDTLDKSSSLQAKVSAAAGGKAVKP